MGRSGKRVSLENKGGGERGRVPMYLQGRQPLHSLEPAAQFFLGFYLYFCNL